ncbi:thiamine phosphate synthase [Xanthovirga aplysinae]|uniref:thiamine phosphate synthase n=1 Tax=Xanthovirga aplysinae TaxID=2529853 RepID=UPI0012BC5E32|nr:thiamine phosphate synthase [Xanthovirga aplysinae]MTI33009.1 thiamine phosphate synthase [Xanthovirga aplysinae]
MKLRVISSPDFFEEESQLVNALFDLGLKCFHLRKPEEEKESIVTFLSKIKEEYRQKIIIHGHFQLAYDFNLGGIHLTELHRRSLSKRECDRLIMEVREMGKKIGSAFHQKEAFQEELPAFDYYLVSPLFESISKVGYKPKEIWEPKSIKPEIRAALVGLGGVELSRIPTCKAWGFEEVAVLGTIWHRPDKAIEKFKALQKACQQNNLMY